jgi:RHH-type proline utilization regulon transcriptional repressor/proline dehydrogenase/delta 1-pyrroline-5-carboxylate dehydrogenase
MSTLDQAPSPSEEPLSQRIPADQPPDHTADELADEAVELAGRWLTEAATLATKLDEKTGERLNQLIEDPDGVVFAMRFVDRVVRPEDHAVAAAQLAGLVEDEALPGFLSSIDKTLLRAGAKLGPLLPSIVIPLARRRMRQLVGHLVVDADDEAIGRHLAARRSEDFSLNVNQLGEAVLGGREADRRLEATTALLGRPGVTYASIKVSAVVPRLNPWTFDHSVDLVVDRLRPLFRKAAASSPATFINLDMEEYRDLELTTAAFTTLLDEPEFHAIDAGIVLQAYLPDCLPALQGLVDWAGQRQARVVDGVNGGEIKIRLVKGANLAMERVESAMHGWPQAPYDNKHDTDANYKRCLDWVLTRERTAGVRIGVASHNLFDMAFAHLLADRRGVSDRIEFEMLEGMAPGLARTVRNRAGGLLLYTPVVDPDDFDVAISYLFRRLEENASDENFIRHLFDLTPGGPSFAAEEAKFRAALAARNEPLTGPSRSQDRSVAQAPVPVADYTDPVSFENEADTDPALAANRRWAIEVMAKPAVGPKAPILAETAQVDDIINRTRAAAADWAARPASERRAVLHRVADELANRRGDLISTMVHEANKTLAQADVEVSEAIDFARWYGDRSLDLHSSDATFRPLGVVAVVPPWNFPVAIPAGGVLASLAAGNGVVFKPAPQVPRCAEVVAECCWAAGVPDDLLAYTRTGDDEVGQHLVSHPGIDTVILTGAYETAELFRSWRPDLPILAETSGKNALVITANADIDEAVADLVDSAFGHSGQKCSAASLAILVGPVAHSVRFHRQLVDAVTSLVVGRSDDLTTDMGPVIEAPTGKLDRALTHLEPGQRWLVEPRRIDDDLWTPGIITGVEPGSWFHQTECFGPVLGLMAAPDLDTAIEWQNNNDFGLTGGIHSLDPTEVDRWLDRVEIGNAYINRVITGAIVRRQPFGGWKRSSVGPGAKAGGVNYLFQLGHWQPEPRSDDGAAWLAEAAKSDRTWWEQEFGVEHDHAGLFCEANIFRYRPLPAIGLIGADHDPVGADRVRAAAAVAGVPVLEGPTPQAVIDATVAAGGPRIRVLDPGLVETVRDAAHSQGLHLADDPVTADGRIELLHYLREQSISRTLHRHGNLL